MFPDPCMELASLTGIKDSSGFTTTKIMREELPDQQIGSSTDQGVSEILLLSTACRYCPGITVTSSFIPLKEITCTILLL